MSLDRVTRADTATKRMEAARRNRERLIFERNVLVAILTRLWPSHLRASKDATHFYLCVHAPGGQLGWRITAEERETIFSHLSVMLENDWDGHTHEEKILRLCQLAQTAKLKETL